MRKFFLILSLYCSSIAYAAPEIKATAFDYRLLNWQSRDGYTNALLDSGTISSFNTGYNEVFDQSFSNGTGTAIQNSFVPNSLLGGPVFLNGSGSAAAGAIAGRTNTTRSAFTSSFESTEEFTATLSGTLQASYAVTAIFESAAWVKLWDGDPLSGTLIWSYELVSGLPYESDDFSYTGTFLANKMYVLEVNAYSLAYLDPPEEPFPHSENQNGSYEFTFELEVPLISIDVIPGNAANNVYPNKAGKLPVAILSSTEFDATQVDPATLKLGPAEAGIAEDVTITNVDGQSGDDMTAKFNVGEIGILCNDNSVTLTGNTYTGELFEGTDMIDATECESGGCHAY